MAGKSLRTAFIRVSRDNNTENGVVVFEKNDIQKIIDDWLLSMYFEYFFILHQEDEECSNLHYHIVLRFKTPVPFDVVKNKFPYGKIENARNIKACVQYLVHLNSPDKKQYSWDDVITNVKDIAKYKIKSDAQCEIDIREILERIDKGEIKEYNQYSAISIELWSKYRTRIQNALLYYKERVCMDKNRQITVIFCEGDTGTGKTSFSKELAEKKGLSYCVSSCSNDPLQDYKGEDVLIMDDLRDTEFCFTDLLKILDNHTKSTIKSRYNNKSFIGSLIVITSFKPLLDWYLNICDESRKQLFRRISQLYKFTKDNIVIYQYFNNIYVPVATCENKYYKRKHELVMDNLSLVEGILDYHKLDEKEKEIEKVKDLFNKD